MKHAESFAIKIPIAFPCMLFGIILKQHPNIMNQGDVKKKKAMPLNFDRKMFIRIHISDIMAPQVQDGGRNYPLISKATKNNMLIQLIEVSKALQDTINATTARKEKIDALISLMKK